MKSSSYIGLAIFLVIVVFGFVFLVKNSPAKNTAGNLSAIANMEDWSKGATSSAVTLVEYSDFQCPACASYYPLVKELSEKYKNDVTFIYRHFPLIQIHINADFAAQASEAAGKQGKFWDMHDMLFDKQNEWANVRNGEEVFTSYAKEIGLDLEKFKTDFKSEEVRRKINEHYKSGMKSGVTGTPTFFLNGEKIQSPNSKEAFEKLLVDAINLKNGNTTNTNQASTTKIDFSITK